jgi:hypothetical protein
VVWMWRRRWLRMAGAGIGYAQVGPGPAISPEEVALRERIRRETEWQERDEP